LRILPLPFNFAADGIRQGSRIKLAGEMIGVKALSKSFTVICEVPGIFQTFISSFLW
jgi:hypothetical protein